MLVRRGKGKRMEDQMRIKAARAGLITGSAEVTMRDLQIGDAGWIAARHGELYSETEGYNAQFECFVMRLLAEFIETRDPATERAFIPDIGGLRFGSVFCVRDDPQTARLRMFFLEPWARGLGLAPKMLEAVIDHARATGAQRLVLWTHASHVAAGKLYKRRGFELRGERRAVAFGVDELEQEYELPL